MSELLAEIEAQISGVKTEVARENVGTVREIGDGVAKLEGLSPALESSNAIAEVIKAAPEMSADQIIIINLSGRGDKDVAQVAEMGIL